MVKSTWSRVGRLALVSGLWLLMLTGASWSQEAPSAAEAEAEPGPQGMKVDHDLNLADLAWEYLEALLMQQPDRAGKFLTAESHYQDFSMEFFGRERVDIKGGKAIVEFWKAAAESSGTIEAQFDADQFFVAGPNVYFMGTGSVKSEGKGWGVNMDVMDFSFTQISHIRMVDGKVTYHADHIDYASAFEQMNKYREDAGPWVPKDKKKSK